MKIEKTSLDGVLVLEPEFRFEDHRGEIVCALERNRIKLGDIALHQAGHIYTGIVGPEFIKHNFSVSYKNVLRGIHVSNCFKLAYCPFGSIYLVAVDCRQGSESFGQWVALEVNGNNRKMILIPPMFGLAHLVRSQIAVFYYHWSGGCDGDEQVGYRWDSFGIEWPTKKPILSERDRSAAFLYFKRETSGFSDAPSEQLRKMAEEDQR